MDYFQFEEEKPYSIVDSVYYVFENYGWHLLILLVIMVIVYNKVLKSYIEKFKQYKFDREYAAKYHKNPDKFAAYVSAQQQWAEKMQEKYNREAQEQQKKMKEREERKKQELLEKYGGEGGHVLGSGPSNTSNISKTNKKDDNKPNTLKPGYNPLMGAGSSSNYRPPRRSPCGGGGCGR